MFRILKDCLILQSEDAVALRAEELILRFVFALMSCLFVDLAVDLEDGFADYKVREVQLWVKFIPIFQTRTVKSLMFPMALWTNESREILYREVFAVRNLERRQQRGHQVLRWR